MHLVFVLAGDGPTYADFPGSGTGVVGEAVVGPVGLVEALEVQLGLRGPRRCA